MDAGVLVKRTEAFIAGAVYAERDIAVDAVSLESIKSIATAHSQADGATIAGAGGVYILNATTRAFVDAGADVYANGNVLISADDSTGIDVSAGTVAIRALNERAAGDPRVADQPDGK